jgi:hypothetical protein
MKHFKIFSIVVVSYVLTYTAAFALSFKGSGASEAEVMAALRQGKASVNGKKIVIKTGITVPADMKTKWNQNQFSGQDAPVEGSESPDVIFVESI